MEINNRYFYKIVSDNPENGIEINTQNKIDYDLINRISELNYLFKLIYNCSNNHKISIKEILDEIEFGYEILDSTNQLKKDLEKIKKEAKLRSFIIKKEFKYFTYNLLEIIRNEINDLHKSNLPNRFKSSYFFGCLKDCKRYLSIFYGEFYKYYSLNLKIIEVQLLKIDTLKRFDNNLLTNFQNHYHSIDFYNTLADFLKEKKSKNPLYEYVFQGSYMVINNDIDI